MPGLTEAEVDALVELLRRTALAFVAWADKVRDRKREERAKRNP